MKWHAADVARGLEAGYLMVGKSVRADHQVLKLLCAKLENRGVIRGALDWDDRRWRLFTEGTLEHDEVDGVIAAGLAVYVPAPVAQAIEEEGDPDCGWITPGDVRALLEAAADRSDRSIGNVTDRLSDRISRDQSTVFDAIGQAMMRSDNLVVIDYDLGGEIQNRLTREQQRNKAIIGAKKRAGQLALPLPGGPVASGPIGPNEPPIDRSTDRSAAAAEHGSRFTEDRSPPTPPSGGPSSEVVAGREEQEQLDRFWGWFLRARPPELRTDRWGGARFLCLAAIVTRAAAEGKPVGPFLVELEAVLTRLFADHGWVRGMARSDRHFKSWVRQGDYWQPPAPPAPVLQIVRKAEPSPAERRRGVLLMRLERADVPEEEKERIRAELGLDAAEGGAS